MHDISDELYRIIKANNCSSIMAFLILLKGENNDKSVQSIQSKSIYDATE